MFQWEEDKQLSGRDQAFHHKLFFTNAGENRKQRGKLSRCGERKCRAGKVSDMKGGKKISVSGETNRDVDR